MDDVAGKATLPANPRRIPIPAAALSQWLAEIDDIAELKVTLRALALLADEPQRGRTPPSITLDDLLDDKFLATGLVGEVERPLRVALAAAVSRGTLVAVQAGGAIRILLNNEDCRPYVETAGITELTAADLTAAAANASEPLPQPPTTAEPRANIFALYEQHIGPYGHSIAEQLRAAEEEYPLSWIEDAFAEAVDRNARSWGYVSTILRRWKREGRHEHGKFGGDSEADSRKTVLDEYRERYGRLPWETDDIRP